MCGVHEVCQVLLHRLDQAWKVERLARQGIVGMCQEVLRVVQWVDLSLGDEMSFGDRSAGHETLDDFSIYLRWWRSTEPSLLYSVICLTETGHRGHDMNNK